MPPKFDRLLSGIPELQPHAARLEHLARLQAAFRAALPGWLDAASRVGWLDGRTLLLVADSGTAAASLRQQLPSLLARVQAVDGSIERLKVTVRVRNGSPAEESRTRAARLSPAAAQALEALADRLPPSALREKVEDLARRAKSDSDEHQPLDDIEERHRGE